jgi:serine/threonine protein kinase
MDKYEVLGKRSFGAQSNVFNIVRKDAPDYAAVKEGKLPTPLVAKRYLNMAASATIRERALREAALLQSLSNPHVMPVLDAFGDGDDIVIIMPAATCTLKDAIKSAGGFLTPLAATHVAWQLAEALVYIHSRKILHRDIKPDNIMLRSDAAGGISSDAGPAAGAGAGSGAGATAGLTLPGNFDVSLCELLLSDFGTSAILEGTEHAGTAVGTQPYMAPEVLNDEPYDSAADLWSYGVTILQAATGVVLGGSAEARRKLRKGDWELGTFMQSELVTPDEQERWRSLPSTLSDLLFGVLNIDPAKRLTASSTLASPFLEPARAAAQARVARAREEEQRALVVEVKTLRQEKVALVARAEAAESKASALETKVTSLETKVSGLGTKVSGLEKDLAAATKQAADEKTAHAATKRDLLKSQGDLATASTKLDEASTKLTAANAEVARLEAELKKRPAAVANATSTAAPAKTTTVAPPPVPTAPTAAPVPSSLTITLPSDTGATYGLCALGSDRIAICCGVTSNSVFIYDTRTGTQVARLQGHTDTVHGVCALRDGRVASCAYDKTIRVWSVTPGKTSCDFTLTGHTGHVYDVVQLPDGRLASAGVDKTIRIWNLSTQKCEAELTGHTDMVFPLVLLPNGNLASGSKDNSFRVWDVAGKKCLHTVVGHGRWPSGLGTLKDGRFFAVSEKVRIFDPKRSYACVETFSADTRVDVRACLASDGRIATASYSGNGIVRFWDISKPTATTASALKAAANSPINFILSLPDGRMAMGSGMTVKIDSLPPA